MYQPRELQALTKRKPRYTEEEYALRQSRRYKGNDRKQAREDKRLYQQEENWDV